MLEPQAQTILLVRAFEESDGEGRLLSSYARATATRRALRVTGLASWPQIDADRQRYAETVIRRARVLFESLERKIPALRAMMRVAQLGVTTGPFLIVTAFVVGLVAVLAGSERRIGLVSLPVLAILAWNSVFYTLRIAALFSAGARRAREVVPWLAERFLRGALWRRLHGWRVGKHGPREWEGLAGRALVRFAGFWHRLAGPLLAARVRRTLHLAAAALALGVLVACYGRGLTLAAAVPWILGLYVVAPRLVLALGESWRCRKLRDLDLDLRDAYFRRVFTEWRGGTRCVEIVPYSYAPKEETLRALRRLLQDYFGARADVRERAPLCHGDNAQAVHGVPRSTRQPWSRSAALADSLAEPSDPERETCHVVLFNMAQPPESEVHASFLAELMHRLAPVNGRLVVIVDSTAYHGRVPDPERWAERFAAWQRVVRGAGLTAIELDPERPHVEDSVEALGGAIWRAAEPLAASG